MAGEAAPEARERRPPDLADQPASAVRPSDHRRHPPATASTLPRSTSAPPTARSPAALATGASRPNTLGYCDMVATMGRPRGARSRLSVNALCCDLELR